MPEKNEGAVNAAPSSFSGGKEQWMTQKEGVAWLEAWREIHIPIAMQKYSLLEPKMNGRRYSVAPLP